MKWAVNFYFQVVKWWVESRVPLKTPKGSRGVYPCLRPLILQRENRNSCEFSFFSTVYHNVAGKTVNIELFLIFEYYNTTWTPQTPAAPRPTPKYLNFNLALFYTLLNPKKHADFKNAASSKRKAPLKPHCTHKFTAKISAKLLKNWLRSGTFKDSLVLKVFQQLENCFLTVRKLFSTLLNTKMRWRKWNEQFIFR